MRTLVDIISDECRRSEAKARVLFSLGVALKKLDRADPDSIREADEAIRQANKIVEESKAVAS